MDGLIKKRTPMPIESIEEVIISLTSSQLMGDNGFLAGAGERWKTKAAGSEPLALETQSNRRQTDSLTFKLTSHPIPLPSSV